MPPPGLIGINDLFCSFLSYEINLGEVVTDGCIHVLFLAFCFSVSGFTFISQIHFSIHLFSLFSMYDSILTWLFLYKQLLKSCHAVSQTQGRTDPRISKTLLSFSTVSVILGADSILASLLLITNEYLIWM